MSTTTASITGHLAMFQTSSAVEPRPTASPTAVATGPVSRSGGAHKGRQHVEREPRPPPSRSDGAGTIPVLAPPADPAWVAPRARPAVPGTRRGEAERALAGPGAAAMCAAALIIGVRRYRKLRC